MSNTTKQHETAYDATTAHLTTDEAGHREWLKTLTDAGLGLDDAIDAIAESLTNGPLEFDGDWNDEDMTEAHEQGVNDAVRDWIEQA